MGGKHKIEDCSTYSVILLFICWYVYAIYGNILIVSDNKDKHCYVAADSDIPLQAIPAE